MAKQATEKQLIQFRGDYQLMRRKYRNNQMALVLNVHPSNLSAYGRGTKNPGVEFLDKFYSIYGEEIKAMAYKLPDDEFGRHVAEDPGATIKYLHAFNHDEQNRRDETHDIDESQGRNESHSRDDREDHINTLKKNNATLLAGITKMIDNNAVAVRSTELANSNTERALKTTEEAVKNNTIVTKTNNQLIHIFTSRLTIRRRRGDSGRK